MLYRRLDSSVNAQGLFVPPISTTGRTRSCAKVSVEHCCSPAFPWNSVSRVEISSATCASAKGVSVENRARVDVGDVGSPSSEPLANWVPVFVPSLADAGWFDKQILIGSPELISG